MVGSVGEGPRHRCHRKIVGRFGGVPRSGPNIWILAGFGGVLRSRGRDGSMKYRRPLSPVFRAGGFVVLFSRLAIFHAVVLA